MHQPPCTCRLQEASGLAEAAKKAGQAPAKAKEAAAEGAAGVGGALKKAASVAAVALGVGGLLHPQPPSKPWETAAHYLGADSLQLTADTLKGWCAGGGAGAGGSSRGRVGPHVGLAWRSLQARGACHSNRRLPRAALRLAPPSTALQDWQRQAQG